VNEAIVSPTNRMRRQASERRGRASELLGAAWLVLKGYRILARRYRTGFGEIDLIAVRGRRLAFVEVKQRATLAEAEAATTPRQAARMARAAENWLWRHAAYRQHEIGLDTLLLAPWHWPRHQPDALHRV
jgi:putative endonuclease